MASVKRRIVNTKFGSNQRGAALLLTFLMMLVLSGLALAVGINGQNSQLIARDTYTDRLAVYVSEAGWQRARQQIVAGNWTAAAAPGNTYTEDVTAADGATVLGQYQVTLIDHGSSEYQITSSGYVPNTTNYTARRQIVEYEITASSSGGTNYSLTATAAASSSNASYPASNANDGNTSTRWEASSNGDAWLRMDYGSATTLNQIIVNEQSHIDDVTIEWSDDASSWTTASGLSVTESGGNWTATFTAVSHRYFRASIDAPSSKKPSVKEMESYSTSSALSAGSVATQW